MSATRSVTLAIMPCQSRHTGFIRYLCSQALAPAGYEHYKEVKRLFTGSHTRTPDSGMSLGPCAWVEQPAAIDVIVGGSCNTSIGSSKPDIGRAVREAARHVVNFSRDTRADFRKKILTDAKKRGLGVTEDVAIGSFSFGLMSVFFYIYGTAEPDTLTYLASFASSA